MSNTNFFSDKDILDILSGKIKPNDGYNLVDLFNIRALKFAIFLYDTEKNVGDDELALSYKNKIFNIANLVIDNNHNTLSCLLRECIIAMGKVNNIEWLKNGDEGKTSNEWGNYIEASIQSAFQIHGKITKAEINAYNDNIID